MFKNEYNFAGRSIDWFYGVLYGIYPSFSILLKTIPNPTTKWEKSFSKEKDAFRKGAEPVHAVLFSRWYILAHISRFGRIDDIHYIASACEIMHNMVMECRDSTKEFDKQHIAILDPVGEVIPIRSYPIPPNTHDAVDCFRERANILEGKKDHKMSQNALADAFWNRHGGDDQQLFDVECDN